MASPHLANYGNDHHLSHYMPGIVSGETICAIAVTEPGAGSDVAAMRTRAVKDGDHWILNGSKMFITNGVHGDVYFVAARTDPEAKGSKGITIFIVEEGMPGSTRWVGAAPIPPSSSSRTAGCRRKTSLVRLTAASTRS